MSEALDVLECTESALKLVSQPLAALDAGHLVGTLLPRVMKVARRRGTGREAVAASVDSWDCTRLCEITARWWGPPVETSALAQSEIGVCTKDPCFSADIAPPISFAMF